MSAQRARSLLLASTALLGPALAGLTLALLFSPDLFVLLRAPSAVLPVTLGLSGSGLFAASALACAVLSQRSARGTPGRLRGMLVGYAFGVGFAASLLAGLLLMRAAGQLPSGAQLALSEALLLAPSPLRQGLLGALVGAGAGALLGVAGAISAWFLISQELRSRLFWLVDGLLLLLLLWSLSFPPALHALLRGALMPPDGLAGQTLRLCVAFLVALRVAVRLLPYLLNLIELLSFRSLVAARHLRAKKSGFLAAIAFLSILAVSVSSCALTTTLSVMGGFRQDLKRKILGNNAHIVIDVPHARLPAGRDPQAQVRAVPGVRGVSSYVSGEVMISSSSNLSGAVLRGIDPAHIAEVSELPNSIKDGSLEYLVHPEKLTRGSLSPASSGKHRPKVRRLDSDDDLAKLDARRLSEQLDALMRDSKPSADGAQDDPRSGEDEAKSTSETRTLPGIVVGRELARSLRLYVGDEVNIVTPLGALGPTGPMPKSRPFRVAGVFFSGMYEYDMKFAYVTLEAAQSFLGTGPELSGVEVTVHEPDRAAEIAQVISQKLADKQLRVRPWQELNKNLFGALALEKLAMFIALGIAILVASFCVGGTLTLMVQEKGREVAVLKAMGAADRAIVAIFVLEGALIGLFGSLLGLSLGYVVCFAAEKFGVRLNPEVYYIDRLPVHMDPSEFLTVGLSAIAVCLLVTIYPAQLASRLRPVDALRFE